MNQIEFGKKQKIAFTVAEVLVVMAILGIFAMAAATTLSKKQQRPSKISPHGQFECYVKPDGNVYQRLTIEKNTGAEQLRGTVGTAAGSCSFTPPSSKAAYYMVAMVGGGGSGSYNNGVNPSLYDYGGWAGKMQMMFFPTFATPPVLMQPGAKGERPVSGGQTGGKGGNTYFAGLSTNLHAIPVSGGNGGTASTIDPSKIGQGPSIPSTPGDTCNGKVIFHALASPQKYLCVDATDTENGVTLWRDAADNCTSKGMRLPTYVENIYGSYPVCDASHGDNTSEICLLWNNKTYLGISEVLWSGTLYSGVDENHPFYMDNVSYNPARKHYTDPGYTLNSRCVKDYTPPKDNSNSTCDSPNKVVGNLCVTPTDALANFPVATPSEYGYLYTNGIIPSYYVNSGGNYNYDYWAPAMAACKLKGSVWRLPTLADFGLLYNSYASGVNPASLSTYSLWGNFVDSSNPYVNVGYCSPHIPCTPNYAQRQNVSMRYRCVKDYTASDPGSGSGDDYVESPTASGLLSGFDSYVKSGGYTFAVTKSGDGGNATKDGYPGGILIVW